MATTVWRAEPRYQKLALPRPVPTCADPLADDLLTTQNAALLPIDYQPSPLAAVRRTARNASA